MLVHLLAELEQEKREMEAGIFIGPPQDWPAFQRRYGEWLGLDSAIRRITAIIEGEEVDERNK